MKFEKEYGGRERYVSARLLADIARELAVNDGPMSASELAAVFDVRRPTVNTALAMFRTGIVPFARIRVASFRAPVHRGPHTPLYAFGDAPDNYVRKRKCKRTATRLRRQLYGAIENARKRAKYRDYAMNPFDGLIQRR